MAQEAIYTTLHPSYRFDSSIVRIMFLHTWIMFLDFFKAFVKVHWSLICLWQVNIKGLNAEMYTVRIIFQHTKNKMTKKISNGLRIWFVTQWITAQQNWICQYFKEKESVSLIKLLLFHALGQIALQLLNYSF